MFWSILTAKADVEPIGGGESKASGEVIGDKQGEAAVFRAKGSASRYRDFQAAEDTIYMLRR